MSVNQRCLSETESAERHTFAFRIAFAASIGFTLGYQLGWDFPFLPSLFAVQLLSARRSLDLKQAFGFVALMAVGGALGVAGIGVPFVEAGIALSVIVLGAIVVLILSGRRTAATGVARRPRP